MRRLEFAVSSLVLAAACAAPRLPVETTTYFPMEANSAWLYRFEEVEQGREFPVSVRSRGPRFVPELGRVAAIFDEEYPDQTLPVAFFFSDGFLQSEIRLGYEEDRRVGVFPIGTEPMRLMPMPPEIGRHWAYSAEVFPGRGTFEPGFAIDWTGWIELVDGIEVPAGVFDDCLRVESIATHRGPVSRRSSRHRYVDWYAPNTGLVRSEYSPVDGERVITRMALVTFQRGPRGSAGNLILVRGSRSTAEPPRS